MSSNRPEKNVLESLPLKTMTASALPFMIMRIMPAVLIALSVTLMALHKTNALPVEKFRTSLVDAVTPVLTVISAPFISFVTSIDGVETLRDLKAENILLREENQKLQQWYESALKLQAENLSLRELLNVKSDPGLSFITARIIGDAGGAYVKSALVPAGTRDHVQKGAAVMSGKGLVGRVVEAGEQSSRVLLITDLNSRIPVILQNTRIRAILSGKNQDLLRLERLPADSGISVGTRVMTSGAGGRLPPDIPVGTIVSTGPDGVWVRPLSDIERLTYVQIVNTNLDPSLVTGDVSSEDDDVPVYKSRK